MTRLTIYGVAAVMTAVVAGPARAQTKTIQGEMVTLTVSIEAIDRGNREVSAKKPDGTHVVFYVPEAVKRFDTLKVGDKVTARYYENLVLRVKAPGEKAVDTGTSGVTRSEATTAATAARQRTITATITAIDMKVPSITFTGPRNWTYSSRVADLAALATVKVGDRLDITWSEALILSIDAAK